TFTARVAVQHDHHSFGPVTLQVTVAADPQPPESPLHATALPLPGVREGDRLDDVVVATFRDDITAYPDECHSAVIDWGDGSSSAGTISADASHLLSVHGSHTYIDEGGYLLTVTVADEVGHHVTVYSTALVRDVPLSLGGQGLIVKVGEPITERLL